MSDPVRVDSVSVRLGDREVLEDVTFSVPRGSLVAVLGPNGSGKSTLLRAMVGLVEPHSGSILVDGLRPARVPVGRIGYVPQVKSLDRAFPARAVDLVVSAARGRWPWRVQREDRDTARAAMALVGATHLCDRPLGSLSGGELQRIYLARAVARSPGVVLLDEPETGVDASGTADLHALLDRFRAERNAAVILVTHDWEIAIHHATHVLLLRNRQISFGPPESAFTESSVRAAFGHVGHAHGMLSALGAVRG